mmetsp:Transcript_56192/g.137796  ORF Transcript_56192/g.137796 Transcript_56192/m.137796 type:complete len:250 (-) Transcript_56192:295-1044(-)
MSVFLSSSSAKPPRSARKRTTLRCPAWHATYRHDAPCLLVSMIRAPPLSSSCTFWRCPSAACLIRGVRSTLGPSLYSSILNLSLISLRKRPFLRASSCPSSSTILPCALRDAFSIAVRLPASLAARSAWALSSRSTSSSRPSRAARIRGVTRSGSIRASSAALSWSTPPKAPSFPLMRPFFLAFLSASFLDISLPLATGTSLKSQNSTSPSSRCGLLPPPCTVPIIIEPASIPATVGAIKVPPPILPGL